MQFFVALIVIIFLALFVMMALALPVTKSRTRDDQSDYPYRRVD
jgi:hypothetical protein